MKRKNIMKLLVLAVAVVCAITMASVAIGQIYETRSDMVTHIADIEEYNGYVLKDADGYIAVFYKGRGYPAFITNIPLASLRGVDREDVENGIVVETRQELIALLEDFGS